MTLTQKDFDQVEEIIKEKLDEKIKLLPSKDEFFQKMDEVMGELKTIREEQIIIGHQTTENEERITTLEKGQTLNPPLP